MDNSELTYLLNQTRHQQLIAEAAQRRKLKLLLRGHSTPNLWQRIRSAMGLAADVAEQTSQSIKHNSNPRTLQ